MSQHVFNFSLSPYSITQSFTTPNLFTLYLLPTHCPYIHAHSTLSCSVCLRLAIHKILNMDVENLRCRSVIRSLCPHAHSIPSIHVICPHSPLDHLYAPNYISSDPVMPPNPGPHPIHIPSPSPVVSSHMETGDDPCPPLSHCLILRNDEAALKPPSPKCACALLCTPSVRSNVNNNNTCAIV